MTSHRRVASARPPDGRQGTLPPTPLLLAAGVMILPFISRFVSAQEDRSAQIRRGVESGKAAILKQVRAQDEITYKTEAGPRKARGRVTSRTNDGVWIVMEKGEKLCIPHSQIRQWLKAGMIEAEMPAPCASGPTTLAAFALVTAGVDTGQPAMAVLLSAIEDQEGPGMGTYVRSLRAALWSALLDRPIGMAQKSRYRKLLQRDVNWLVTAALADGSYGYNAEASARGDHSNTQFADLGLWAAAVARIEVPAANWRRIARHWLATQNRDGGWAYMPGLSGGSTPSMTVAGCNSLYIALDRFFSRSDKPYILFEGCPPNREARKGIAELAAAIQRGDDFLRKNPPDVTQSHGYELFGLERLGLASGQVYVGGRDWFLSYANGVAEHEWGAQAIADCFALIFLVHGQSPVLIQKLEHGSALDDWNYYHRDLAALTRYLTRTFERLVRWQRVPETAGVEQLRAAPLLYISGAVRLDLDSEARRRIRNYIDAGGTVFLHADRAGKAFTLAAKSMFEEMFRDRDLRFAPLPATHPLYSCHFGESTTKWKRRPPLQAIEDESRILVYLCPVDIAGAWQDDRKAYEDLYRIMANVRVYSAAPYSELSTSAGGQRLPDPSAPPRGSLRLVRLEWPGASRAHPLAWANYAMASRARAGLTLTSSVSPSPTDDSWHSADILHLSVRGPFNPSDAELDGIRRYLQSGGLLLIDAANGRPDGIAAVRALADRLDVGERGILAADHPIISGTMPGGQPLGALEPTDAGIGLVRGRAPPPIITRAFDGRVGLLACPFDLIGGLDAGFVWNRVGFRGDSTRGLMDNILLWRLNQARRSAGDRTR